MPTGPLGVLDSRSRGLLVQSASHQLTTSPVTNQVRHLLGWRAVPDDAETSVVTNQVRHLCTFEL